jgi:hypothetical protein
MSAASGDKNMIARTKIALPFALDAEARRSGEGRRYASLLRKRLHSATTRVTGLLLPFCPKLFIDLYKAGIGGGLGWKAHSRMMRRSLRLCAQPIEQN